MTPEQFVTKWKAADLKERAAAQSHFNDLCELLDEEKPTDADPKGEWYCFERGATKTTGGEGWADVWKRGCFGWEYKSRGRNLDEAIDQLKRYALALENPPLLIACNLDRFRIVTNWTNAVSERHEFDLDGLYDSTKRQQLKWAFSDPEQLRPGITRQHITEIAARKFAELAKSLRAKGHEPHIVAHFVNRLVFCMFAEDTKLLPDAMFTRMLKEARRTPADFELLCRMLFDVMQQGGRVGFERVDWFNGGLFDDDSTLQLGKLEIDQVLDAANMDWSQIDPSIMGTLFERGLDPDKRSQLGAHYTDAEKIMRIIEPVIQRPLEAEWANTRAEIEALVNKGTEAKSASTRTKARNDAEKLYKSFLDRIRAFRVPDPACGSGNFLYLALQTLKDLEHRASIEAEALGLPREFPRVGPEQLLGIEINPYAAELARVSVWIGEIQWMQRNGFGIARNPILRPLDTIECRDAILKPDGTEPDWPEADVIIGNPPFLGDRKMIGWLGFEASERIRNLYKGRVPRGADLVCYWFQKSLSMLCTNKVRIVGLVATNSIRGGKNRTIIDHIANVANIFDAWSDEPWIVEGAAVRVSIICFAKIGNMDIASRLNGTMVPRIHSDLTSGMMDFSRVVALRENNNMCIHGSKKIGSFDISGELARHFLKMPTNPNGCKNSDVISPVWNGFDITRRNRDKWIIDFGLDMSEKDAALYEGPFNYVVQHLKPDRLKNRNPDLVERWWLHGGPRPLMRHALVTLKRCIATPALAKHLLFVWVPRNVLPDAQLMVTLRDDDTSFGILQSRLHHLWCEGVDKSSLEDRPRYTPSVKFDTFPFPERLTPDVPAATYANDPPAQRIAAAARRLNELRENWLNPPDLVVRVPEVVPGYPDRILPKDEECAKELRKRTLTNLYNQRPPWLDNVHKELDAAVAAAYGWPADLADDEILKRLFELNQERAGVGQAIDTSQHAAVA